MRINAKGNALTIQGDDLDVHLSLRVLNDLYTLLKKGYPLYPADIDYAIRMISDDWTVNLEDIFLDTVYISSKEEGHHTEEPCPEALHRRHPEI